MEIEPMIDEFTKEVIEFTLAIRKARKPGIAYESDESLTLFLVRTIAHASQYVYSQGQDKKALMWLIKTGAQRWFTFVSLEGRPHFTMPVYNGYKVLCGEVNVPIPLLPQGIR
jgi:hypothetical protein